MTDLARLSPAAVEPAADLKAGEKSSQPRGPKGERTRRRILDVTAELLAERPFNDIRVTEIARAAGIAQPNFYTYFANIEEAVLALAREVSTEELVPYIERDWEGEQGLEHARALIEAAMALWARHHAVIAIVGLLADEHHGEFAAVRVRQMRGIYKTFEAKVKAAQAKGRLPAELAPRLVGYECVGLISSAAGRHELFTASGFSRAQIVETTARLLHMIATGEGR
jgi:AcrR family transcriptional regulator